MRSLTGMALLSAAVLLLQVTLTRIFSVAQYYHFAFLVVSLALLGIGASGSLLAMLPRLKQSHWHARYAIGFSIAGLLAYLVLNHMAFDSYSIAWDRTQVYLLVLNLVTLVVPFAFAGALIGTLLSKHAANAGQIYSANLIGSAFGALIAPLSIAYLGSERTVVICVIVGFVAGRFLAEKWTGKLIAWAGMFAGIALLAAFPEVLEVRPSPYKQLSQFHRNPDATIISTRQNAYSQLDIIESPTIHSVPGLSLTYKGDLPEQVGLIIDGSNLYAVSNAEMTSESLLRSVPAAVAYTIRPHADSLVLGSGGGLDALVPLANGAQSVTIIEPNSLVYEAWKTDLADFSGLGGNDRMRMQHEELRVLARNTDARYDIVHLALATNYQPVNSGAFTLTEDYTMTVEAFQSYLNLLNDDGLLFLTRWLQEPPSESLRTLGIILEALDKPDPQQHIIVFRTFQLAAFIIKNKPFTPAETDALLEQIDALRYDLVLAPQMPADMINRYAMLETPIYHDLFLKLVTTSDRRNFYADYDFEITPPTDDMPFFYHYFRWAQTPQIMDQLGQRWQPFGGSGYFVLVALLLFAIVAAIVFIVLPIAVGKSFRRALLNHGSHFVLQMVGYFTALGLAFLMVEVGLIQVFMLILGQPTVAIATVIGALLLFSGIGSAISDRVKWPVVITGLVMLLLLYHPAINVLSSPLLGIPFALRIGAVILLIAPVGLLMGMPFPQGIRRLQNVPELVAWAWAANGSASVISAILAVMVALSFGFSGILFTGALCYGLAGGLVLVSRLHE